jgi:hypothetical protein
LKAQIQTKNFRVLRDYYELVVKDFKLAQLNKNALLSKSKPIKQQAIAANQSKTDQNLLIMM